MVKQCIKALLELLIWLTLLLQTINKKIWVISNVLLIKEMLLLVQEKNNGLLQLLNLLEFMLLNSKPTHQN